MKAMVLIVVFACASITMMQTDVRVVEIAQAQSNSGDVLVALR